MADLLLATATEVVTALVGAFIIILGFRLWDLFRG